MDENAARMLIHYAVLGYTGLTLPYIESMATVRDNAYSVHVAHAFNCFSVTIRYNGEMVEDWVVSYQ